MAALQCQDTRELLTEVRPSSEENSIGGAGTSNASCFEENAQWRLRGTCAVLLQLARDLGNNHSLRFELCATITRWERPQQAPGAFQVGIRNMDSVRDIRQATNNRRRECHAVDDPPKGNEEMHAPSRRGHLGAIAASLHVDLSPNGHQPTAPRAPVGSIVARLSRET